MAVDVYIVGLTGGIGSGKSTVADLFGTLGVAIVDTDAIARVLTGVEGRANPAIRIGMGAEFIAGDGSLDRALTRDRVFADAGAKRKLEAILHPLIHAEVEMALHSEPVQNASYAILVVPLLFETLTYRKRTQSTLLIDCPIATQVERVKRRSGLDADEIDRIVNAQLPRVVRLQLADNLIWNGKMTGSLREQIERLHVGYIQSAATSK